MATISDVAALADVSAATVSRALNGKATVDPELVARVRQAAADLGYHPNGLARSLRTKETAVLALIISDVENPFFTAIARGVEDVAQTAGYSVVLCNSDENVGKESRYIQVAVQERVAGVVLSPSGPGTSVESLDRQGTPVGVRTADDRLAGYTDALRAEGIAFDPDLVRRTEYRADGAHTATRDLLDAARRPDALLVANSPQMIGVLEALATAGLRPGRDVGGGGVRRRGLGDPDRSAADSGRPAGLRDGCGGRPCAAGPHRRRHPGGHRPDAGRPTDRARQFPARDLAERGLVRADDQLVDPLGELLRHERHDQRRTAADDHS